TRMVLTNAIYFQGKWKKEFDKKLTRDEDFTCADGTTHKVPMMHKETLFKYAETDSLQAVELPYVGDEVALLVMLPKQANGMAALEKQMTGEYFNSIVKQMQTAVQVDLSLPRFKVETNYDLVPVMKKLGMIDAFGGNADFSGMYHSNRDQLY